MFHLATTILILPLLVTSTPLLTRQVTSPGYLIHPAGDTTMCLGTLTPGADNVPVFNLPCTGADTRYVVWDLVPGQSSQVVLRGPKGNFCLDSVTQAGVNPLKVYTCYPTIPQQQFFYTADNHLAITGGTKCLAYNGGGCGLGGCAPGWSPCNSDLVQRWPLEPLSTPPPQPTSFQIHPNGDTTKCITPIVRAPSDGVVVRIQGCIAPGQPFANLQQYQITRGVSGQVKLAGTNFCLDAGVSPNDNGVVMKLWTCLDVPQQKWFYTADNHIAITGGTTCLDVKKEDGATLQTWTCGSPNPQQVFTI